MLSEILKLSAIDTAHARCSSGGDLHGSHACPRRNRGIATTWAGGGGPCQQGLGAGLRANRSSRPSNQEPSSGCWALIGAVCRPLVSIPGGGGGFALLGCEECLGGH